MQSRRSHRTVTKVWENGHSLGLLKHLHNTQNTHLAANRWRKLATSLISSLDFRIAGDSAAMIFEDRQMNLNSLYP